MMPTHWHLSQKSIIRGSWLVPPKDSIEKTMTKQIMMMENAHATRSRKLNVKLYRSSENAMIAIPAVRI
jgi:hypothetical protein